MFGIAGNIVLPHPRAVRDQSAPLAQARRGDSVMSADSRPNNPENGYANFTAPIACKMPMPAPPRGALPNRTILTAPVGQTTLSLGRN
jgi:hypothetical protein